MFGGIKVKLANSSGIDLEKEDESDADCRADTERLEPGHDDGVDDDDDDGDDDDGVNDDDDDDDGDGDLEPGHNREGAKPEGHDVGDGGDGDGDASVPHCMTDLKQGS